MPSIEEVAAHLKGVPLFSGLTRPQLRALASIAKEAEYRAGQVVCRQGQPGERYFIIEQGALRATRVDPEGRVLEVRRLGAGEGFGETSLLLGDVRDATVESVQDSLLLYIDKQDFDHLLEVEPRIERALHMRPEVAERRRYPRFSWLEEGELPVKVLRKHAAVLLPRLLLPGFLILFSLTASILSVPEWLYPFLWGLGGIVTLVSLGYSGYLYIDWRNDIYVVTNRRVIHRERAGLVREDISAAPLHAIQDIQQIRPGLMASVWNFGDLIIETAGGAGQVTFRNISDPEEVQREIFTQRDRLRALARAAERTTIEEALRRHFFGVEEVQEEQPSPKGKERRAVGCLGLPLRILSYFLPHTWHREGATITWRKHWIALVRSTGIPALLFLLATVVAIVVMFENPSPSVLPLYALAVFVLFPWLLWTFEDYQNDFYQVTATRVIHVERRPLFLHETRREASLEQVTNVRSRQSFWGRILQYGDVIVETAAPAGTFHFQTVSRPQSVQAEIFAHIEAARRFRQRQEIEQHRAELVDWFAIYDEIRRALPPGQEQERES